MIDRGRRRVLAAGLLSLLSGCGFRLRGQRPLPFGSVFIAGAVDPALLGLIRRRILASGATRLSSTRADAEAVLELLGLGREKLIIGLSGAGKVREYEFRLTLRFRLQDPGGRELIAATALSASREATHDDAAILAKDQEEALLYADMQDELVRQLLRRLEAARPAT